jgi:thioredoxin reductase (NADPH)
VEKHLYDVIIIGAGPAGLTAGLYTSRARFKTLIISGAVPGGQIALTYRVDNYPGFHEPITGPELTEKLIEHATGFGAELYKKEATRVDFSKQPYKVYCGEEVYMAKTVIIATGSVNRRLGLDSEEKFFGRGVFVCATCDAALYEGLKVVVVGGGDSAVQEALDMTNFAKEVYIVHRRDKLLACKCLSQRAEEHDKIKILYNYEVDEILGENIVEAVRLRNLKTDEEITLETDGVLIAIGWMPNTKLFKDQLEIDINGYLVSDGLKTKKPGIFIAGDLNDRDYRQVVTACSSGCMAALEAERYLQKV